MKPKHSHFNPGWQRPKSGHAPRQAKHTQAEKRREDSKGDPWWFPPKGQHVKDKDDFYKAAAKLVPESGVLPERMSA